MSLKNWFKFLLLSFIWGTSFFWIKIGLQEATPAMVVFFRVGFATLGLTLFTIISRKKFSLKKWWLYLFLGFFNVALPFLLISWSEQHITSGMASVLNSTQPLATALIASVFLKEERMTLRRAIGLVLGFAGVLILLSNRLSSGFSGQTLGIIATMVAVLGYGASAVFARLHNNDVSPTEQALGQMSFALLLITPAMVSIDPSFVLPVRPVSYIAFAWLGLLGSFVASVIWYDLMQEIGPSRVSMTTYLLPLIGLLLGGLVLHEKVGWQLLVGGLLIILGIIIVNQRKTPLRPPASADFTIKESYE